MNHQNLSSFIWNVADLLRGDYKQSDYGKIILPFTVLRRLDCVACVLPQYLALLLGSRPLRVQIERSISGADGLANNLPQSTLKAFQCVAPPVTGKIDVRGAAALGSDPAGLTP
ncbi:MAG: type I restriction-modification system subunit M N-terminal domain-containing protein, partial [Hyphomicrobiaceae bacterium]